MTAIIALIIICLFTPATGCQAGFFGVARTAAPVLNSPDFAEVFGGKDGSSLKTDRCGQVRELEYIALPGTVFTIVGDVKRGTVVIYQVETEEYPAPPGIRLYVDSRFLVLSTSAPPARTPSRPPREQILATLLTLVGSPYVWGGNVQHGIPELSHYFYRNVSNSNREQLTLAGLDCSGLLYQASNGGTPRNTSQLVSYGWPVAIKGKDAGEIVRLLEPLDLIVWKGHVVIVLDKQTAIESRLECEKPGRGGVVTTPLLQRLQEVMRTRKAVDAWPGSGIPRNVFVIRRWSDR